MNRKVDLALVTGLALQLTGCPSIGPFGCLEQSDCDRADQVGTCLEDGACAYPDPDCDSGLRRSPNAAVDAGQCVPVGGAASVTSGTATTTATTIADGTGDDTGIVACGNRRRITIATGPLGPEALPGFPLLISLDGPTLDGADPAGSDLYFTTDDGERLAHEIEAFDVEAGTLRAWVRLQSWTPGQPLELWLGYADATAAGDNDPTAVWTDFLGVWHMQGDFDDFARDSSPSGVHGMLLGGIGPERFVPGVVGNAVEFQGGPDEYIEMTESFGGRFESFTVSLWVRVDNGPDEDGTMFERVAGDDLYPRCRRLSANGGNNMFCQIGREEDTVTAHVSDEALAVGTFGMVVLGWDAATGEMEIFVDGVSEGSTNGPPGVPNSGDFHMGLGQVETFGTLRGLIDEVRLAPTFLGASWAAADYAMQSDPASLIAAVGEPEPAPCE